MYSLVRIDCPAAGEIADRLFISPRQPTTTSSTSTPKSKYRPEPPQHYGRCNTPSSAEQGSSRFARLCSREHPPDPHFRLEELALQTGHAAARSVTASQRESDETPAQLGSRRGWTLSDLRPWIHMPLRAGPMTLLPTDLLCDDRPGLRRERFRT